MARFFRAQNAQGRMLEILGLMNDYNEKWQMLGRGAGDELRDNLRERLANVYEARLQALLRGENPYGVKREEYEETMAIFRRFSGVAA